MVVHRVVGFVRMANMILVICLPALLGFAAAVKICPYTHDNQSPFYWQEQENLCTDAMCAELGLDCVYPEREIYRAIDEHYQQKKVNISREVQIMEGYFNLKFPEEYFWSTKDYSCQGVCERPVKRLERIFYDFVEYDGVGNVVKSSRELCFVIGPKIRYSTCSGSSCAIRGYKPANNTMQYNCVPNVVASVDVWLYCPAVVFGSCVKTTLQIPMSCSCVEFTCPIPIPSATKTAAKPSPGQGLFSMDLFGGIRGDSGPFPGMSHPIV